MHIQHAPVSTPALRQVGKLFRELSHVYFPFIWAKTHRRDLRDSSKERWQDSGDVLAPIFSRPNREIADRRMMFPFIHGSISFLQVFLGSHPVAWLPMRSERGWVAWRFLLFVQPPNITLRKRRKANAK